MESRRNGPQLSSRHDDDDAITPSPRGRWISSLRHGLFVPGSVSGGRNSLVLDYLPYLSKLLSEPLINEGAEGVDDVVTRMHAYDLLREDFDNIMDLASFSDSENLREMIDSKVNALLCLRLSLTIMFFLG